MKIITFTGIVLSSFACAQVGINTVTPKTTLHIEAKGPTTIVEGLIIPRLTGDRIYNMAIPTGTTNEGNLIFATSAASVANQVGKGRNLTSTGFFYWNGTEWTRMVNTVDVFAYVKPMNYLLGDNDTYIPPSAPFIAPTAPALKKFDADFLNPLDFSINNNPLNVVMWDNTNKLIKVPSQLLGYTITVNLSLKFKQLTSNAESSRLAAFTGNAVIDPATGTYTGGSKIKDLMFTGTKTASGTVSPGFVRDELVLSPIIITQQIVDHGIQLYLGSAMNGTIEFFEPILTVDYGVVNTQIP